MSKSVIDRGGTSYQLASSHLITTCATLAALILFVAVGAKVLPSAIGLAEAGQPALAVAFLLNIAIIIFGWRRSKDLKEALDANERAEKAAQHAAYSDFTTGLANRRQLTLALEEALASGQAATLMLLDLDDFKKVNDRHGHLVGSHVLMEVAAVILLSVRDTDAVARYGGDEFVIVLPDTGTELAGAVAERIRGKINKFEFTGGKRLQLSLTASFGVATFPYHASSPQQLIACADTAMYEAKAANKNCIRFAAAVNPAPPHKPGTPSPKLETEAPPPPVINNHSEGQDSERPS